MQDNIRESWPGRMYIFACEQEANAATEYAILLGLLVLGSMAVIGRIGSSFRGLYVVICGAIPDA